MHRALISSPVLTGEVDEKRSNEAGGGKSKRFDFPPSLATLGPPPQAGEER